MSQYSVGITLLYNSYRINRCGIIDYMFNLNSVIYYYIKKTILNGNDPLAYIMLLSICHEKFFIMNKAIYVTISITVG